MDLVDSKTLAVKCNVSLVSIYRWGKENRIPGKKMLGRRILYDLDKVMIWLENGGELKNEE